MEERIDHMKYMDDMEQIPSDIMDKVIKEMNEYDPSKYTAVDVRQALSHEKCTVEDFKALLSPAAEDFLEEIAIRAKEETRKHFGNSVYMFTPLYISNYCENYCVYCGFNCHNKIKRAKLDKEGIEKEMAAIAETGLEVYPMNSDEYKYVHECGADYVTVFQETYDSDKYETLHLAGHKRIFPYRLNTQERALMGGMRGVGFAALLGLDDFRKDAFATGMHAYLIQRQYPHAEISFSCPRLRPIINNDKINPKDVHEKQLLQVMCAYRLFMPFAGMTISTRERCGFRNNVIGLAATKISAGVSTGIGSHSDNVEEEGDSQFEICDTRSVDEVYEDIKSKGLQPVMNDYVFV